MRPVEDEVLAQALPTWPAARGSDPGLSPLRRLDQRRPPASAGDRRTLPFLDGNGRTGRLVLNLLRVRLGDPPAIVYKRQRDAYLQALRRSDRGDCGALGELIARVILHNLRTDSSGATIAR